MLPRADVEFKWGFLMNTIFRFGDFQLTTFSRFLYGLILCKKFHNCFAAGNMDIFGDCSVNHQGQ
jgi:hypothetical protein